MTSNAGQHLCQDALTITIGLGVPAGAISAYHSLTTMQG